MTLAHLTVVSDGREADVCLFISLFLFYLSVGDSTVLTLIYLPPPSLPPFLTLECLFFFLNIFPVMLYTCCIHTTPLLSVYVFSHFLLSICLFAEWEDVGTSVGVTSAAAENQQSLKLQLPAFASTVLRV